MTGRRDRRTPEAEHIREEYGVSTQVAEHSLYEQLGGIERIGAVVEDFYSRVLADDLLKPSFVGIDMDRLRRHQTMFVSYALGGPNQYSGRGMGRAHAHLGLTEAHFAAVAGHLDASLAAFDVPSHLIDQVIAHVAGLKDEIVSR
jgi:hemoglobin